MIFLLVAYIGNFASVFRQRARGKAEQLTSYFMNLPFDFKLKKRPVRKRFFLRYWPYLILGFILTIIFILISPYLFRPWTQYPEELRVEIAWQKFSASFDYSCRETCLALRQNYADIWRPFYRNHLEIGEKHFQEVFMGDNEKLQAAVIKILAADYSNSDLPPFLAKLLLDPKMSAENRRLIVVFFPEAFDKQDWLESVRKQIISNELSLKDRVYALSLLAPFPNQQNISLLKNIILSNSEPLLLEEAFKVLASWPAQSLAWQENELDHLLDVIFATKEKELRWRRLWLLGELEAGSIVNRKRRLEELAQSPALDPISRGLAAESLRLEFSLEINTPEPTSSEWQELYEYL